MTAPQTIREAIERNAKGVRHFVAGGQEVESQSIKDQIEADRYVKGQDAVASLRPGFGVRVQKIKPIYP